MTIFQILKRIKHLDRKIGKASARIQRWCSYLNNEEPQYDVEKLIQSTNDMIEEKARLKHALHAINVQTLVEFRGKSMSIDALIGLLTITIPGKINTLKLLRRREKAYGEDKDLKIVINYDPQERDKKIEALEDLLNEAEDVLDNVNLTVNVI